MLADSSIQLLGTTRYPSSEGNKIATNTLRLINKHNKGTRAHVHIYTCSCMDTEVHAHTLTIAGAGM